MSVNPTLTLRTLREINILRSFPNRIPSITPPNTHYASPLMGLIP